MRTGNKSLYLGVVGPVSFCVGAVRYTGLRSESVFGTEAFMELPYRGFMVSAEPWPWVALGEVNIGYH